ncbi:2-C-methyl-D-erythritol 2,4-cyclodiphosphate synthase [Treponema sp. R6D11]
MSIRIGHGADVHKLVAGRDLILGGVLIPHSMGLLGHSDADVLTHAIKDALLGAAGKKSIGDYFPDTEEKHKGASSIGLLEAVVDIIKPYKITNIDCTILAEKPKLAPYIPSMIKALEKVIGENKVNIKATTTEGLGFVGREEGIAAEAVCILE